MSAFTFAELKTRLESYVAAEQAIVKAGRALLIERWGLDADRIVVKGYWKRNESEHHAPH